MEKIYINLSGTKFSSLHPILKNLYKKLENIYKIEYINFIENNEEKEVPTIQKYNGLDNIIFNLKKIANNFIPRLNIIRQNYDSKILTANNFLITKNEYYVITSSLIQFSGLKTKPLYNLIFKLLFKKLLLKNNLKKIYFYSKTAYDEFIRYCKKELKLEEKQFINKLDILYPYLKDNNFVKNEEIINRFNTNKIKFLFIARHFLGKGGHELIKALEIIKNKYSNIIDKFEIDIISDIPEKYKDQLMKLKKKGLNINLHGINFTQDELEKKFYKKKHVLLHLTRADLFGMVSLESKKNGLAVITTKQYLNPELFKDNEALFVKIDKKYIWNDGLPKIDYQTIWNIEEEILNINDIVKNILYCIKNKEKTLELALNNRNSLRKFLNDENRLKELF